MKTNETEEEQKAREVLNYCLEWLSNYDFEEQEKFKTTQRYKDMLKEIEFILTTS
jgi:hypothetical protein